MDEFTRVVLRGAYQFIYGQQEQINNLQIVTSALRKTIRELGPNAEAIYGKHYLAEMQSPGKIAGEQVLEALAQGIRQLSGQSEHN